MNFRSTKLVVILVVSCLSYINCEQTRVENIKPRDYCSCESCVAQKFFILNNLLFFTKNADIFVHFNIFNISSGGISQSVNTTAYLPRTDFRFQEVATMKKLNQNNTHKTSCHLLWMFGFDIIPEHCQPKPNSPKLNSYCSRMKSLRNVIVGRLTNQQLIFVGYRNNKLVPVNDMNLFIEFHSLFKHLDEFGYTSSVTYDQITDRFFTTHYGRMNEICVTKSMEQGNIFSLPSMSEIMNADIFHTICYDTDNQYTSILDINGSFYAIKSTGTVDQIALNSGDGKFDIMQSNSDKLFFNCFSNSPILNKLEATSFEFQLAEKAINARNSHLSFTANELDYAGIDQNDVTLKSEQSAKKSSEPAFNYYGLFAMLLIGLIFSIPIFMFAKSPNRLNDVRRRFKDAFTRTFPPKTRKNRKSVIRSRQNSKMTIRTIKRIPKAKQNENSLPSKTSRSPSPRSSSSNKPGATNKRSMTSTVIFSSQENKKKNNSNKTDTYDKNVIVNTVQTTLSGDNIPTISLQNSNKDHDKEEDQRQDQAERMLREQYRITY